MPWCTSCLPPRTLGLKHLKTDLLFRRVATVDQTLGKYPGLVIHWHLCRQISTIDARRLVNATEQRQDLTEKFRLFQRHQVERIVTSAGLCHASSGAEYRLGASGSLWTKGLHNRSDQVQLGAAPVRIGIVTSNWSTRSLMLHTPNVGG